MNRRHLLTAAGAAIALRPLAAHGGGPAAARPFSLKFAPHFGMFQNSAGKDLVDQLRFAADHGFTAWEDNGMKGRPVRQQERIAETMERLGMEMGVISALRGVWGRIHFDDGDAASRDAVLAAMRGIVDVAKRVGAKWLTVVPGMANPKVPHDYQTASCVALLRRCCDIVEPHGLVMVLEPLNQRRDHPGVFLSGAAQAFSLCRAVDRPSCKILYDIYHQQVTEGNLIPNIDRCWSEIAYLQTADNPGRNEPGTGEINFANIMRRLHEKAYRGIIGMEHGNSQRGASGERAVIDAYRRIDPA